MTTVHAHLAQLEAADLIRRAEAAPEPAYLFRHALVQDAAYASLLRSDRKRLHLAVGETLEALYAEQRDELAAVLGHHFAEAEDARALAYFIRAGDYAARHYATTEAEAHYRRALALSADQTVTGETLRHLCLRLGRMLELTGNYQAALAHYIQMCGLAERRQDRALELAALTAQATIRATPTVVQDLDQAEALCLRALPLARTVGDQVAEARILWNLMLRCRFVGEANEALRYGEQSLALARALGLREQMAYTLNDMVYSYLATDQPDHAEVAREEAMRLWRELGNMPLLSDTLSSAGMAAFMAGAYDSALPFLQEALEISQRANNIWGISYSQMWLGAIALNRGDFSLAAAALEEAAEAGVQAGFLPGLVGSRAFLALLYCTLGAFERADALLHDARRRVEGLAIWEQLVMVSFAYLRAAEGDVAAAESILQAWPPPVTDAVPLEQASFNYILGSLTEVTVKLRCGEYDALLPHLDTVVAGLEQLRASGFIDEVMVYKGEALLHLGRMAEAEAVLVAAHGMAAAQGKERLLWQIEAHLATAAAAQGEAARAADHQHRAHGLVVAIADRIDEPALRASFLNLPPVRAVLDLGA